MEPTIIFEDDYLMVVDKPSGLVVNDSATTNEQLTVQKWFADKIGILRQAQDDNEKEFVEKGGIVHRLDRDTSGVMVLAKTAGAYDNLKMQFLERKTKKKYTALIHGKLRDAAGEVSKPVTRHPKDRHRFTVGGDLSRTAITEWKKVAEYKRQDMEHGRVDELTLMDLFPHTGRTHQLRVHMQYLHHPIVSDRVYGFRKTWQEDLIWCPRLFLHAYELELSHPQSGKPIIFKSGLPEMLEQVLRNLLH